MRRLREAEAFARKAIEVDPSLPDAFTTLGVILSTVRAERRRRSRAGSARSRSTRTQFNALYNLWFELAAAGRRDEASAYGRQFVASAPPAFFQPDIDRIKRYLAGV